MSARLVRRLLLLAVILTAGYGLGWADRAYGHTPILLLCLVAAVSWLAGAAWVVLPLTLAVSEANRERDEIAARLAQIEDGGTYAARSVLAHPSVRSKVYPLPKQARR